MFIRKITHRFMHDVKVEMYNWEKFLEDYRVCMNHDYHALWLNMEYSRN